MLFSFQIVTKGRRWSWLPCPSCARNARVLPQTIWLEDGALV